jgi:SAM-dependent methyltransferase
MPEILEKCPLCSEKKSLPFDRRKYKGYVIENRICAHCGLVFLSPRMTEKELDAFYRDEYSQLYRGEKGILPREISTQHGRAAASLDFISGFVSSVQRHLDFGCSTGIQLDDFHQKYGSEMVGVEPDPVRREHAGEKGVAVYASLDDLLEGERGNFDLISLFHVLEHLSNPVQYLTLFRERFLAPGGWLLIEVPNLYGHDSFEVAHLFAFSSHTLVETLRRTGFEITALKTHGKPASKILPLYLTVLAQAVPVPEQANPYNPVPERWVAAKRKLGLLKKGVYQRLLPQLAWQPVE